MSWVVMKEHERPNFSVDGEIHRRAQRTVSPADMMLVFFVGVLRIENQDIAALQESHQIGAFVPGPFSVCSGLTKCDLTE